MTSSQQQETLDYFNRFAADWKQKAEGAVPEKVNVVRQRNDYVLHVAAATGARHALDVGCGTGDLVCALAAAGVRAVGVDFAPDMIALCHDRARACGATDIEFVHASVFDYQPAGARFDLISANGFIEYVSEQQLTDFLARARTLLAPGGSLVVGSRNRLYNAFSLNEYTQLEIDNGAHARLVDEALLFARAATLRDAVDAAAAADAALPAVDAHPTTGIGVTTRHQYTPGQLARRVTDAGFAAAAVHPVHYHGAPPRFRSEHASAHVAVATLMQGYAAECHYLIPFASTFMLHATLPGDG